MTLSNKEAVGLLRRSNWRVKKRMQEEFSAAVRNASREREEAYAKADELPHDLAVKAQAVAEDIYDMRLKTINDKHKGELARKS